ncbi:MAG TPA: hypothetical protein H9896_04135 [Candidatus Pygmaiobacter gallistercoris]|nr:hypothetical protein [Candidatus Pygmaiobacter gallistercoris]
MFQVKKIEHANKTFRMPCDLIDQLEKLAQEKDVSLNQLVIQCCQYALDHLDRGEDAPRE